MKYIVILNKVSGAVYYYENKNCLEEQYLFVGITLAKPVDCIISTNPTINEGMQEIQSVADLFGLISSIALKSR